MKKIYVFTIIIMFIFALRAYSISYCNTYQATNISYNAATLNGSINSNLGDIYGFEFWEEGGTKTDIEMGENEFSGNLSQEIVLFDDTKYYYQTYVKKSNDEYIYGEIVDFKTERRKKDEIVEVDFDFSDIDFQNASLADTPNMFFLNNFIKNNKDGLQVLVGKNFDGIDYISAIGEDNILINQFFMKEYYNNVYLKTVLSLFDVLVYNSDSYADSIFNGGVMTLKDISDDSRIIDAIISDNDGSVEKIKVYIPETLYKTSGTYIATQTIKNMVNDVQIKRYESAINEILRQDYQSNDKRTFGYEKGMYNQLDALSSGAKKTKKLIKDINDGKNNIEAGLESYQTWYVDKILPRYSVLCERLLDYQQKLIENSKDDAVEEYNESCRKHSKELTAYGTLAFIDEEANIWKNKLEYSYFATETIDTLEKCGKSLSIYQNAIDSYKLLNQLTKNESVLKNTFIRLCDVTEDNSLKVVLNKYIDKMNNNVGAFIVDSAKSIYDTFIKKTVKKALEEKIEPLATDMVMDIFGAYADKATDIALSKANAISFALDIGGFASEKISNTETLLKKAIEIKYLWKLENELRIVLQNDFNQYKNIQNEELAKIILNELIFLKSVKLRALMLTNEFYQANGSSKYISLFYNDDALYSNINNIYENQRDVLISTSLIEGEHISEILKIEDKEQYITFDRNELNHDGVITANNKQTLLSTGVNRLTGGVEVFNGGEMFIQNQNSKVYIPYIHIKGGTLLITGKDVTIGELIIDNGTLIIENGGNIKINDNFIHNGGTVKVQDGDISIGGNYNQIGGILKIEDGNLIIGGNYRAENNFEDGDCNLIMQNENAYMLVSGDFYVAIDRDSTGLLTAGTLELKGNFQQRGDRRGLRYYTDLRTVYGFCPTDKHRVIFSGNKQQYISRQTWQTYTGEEQLNYPTCSYFNIIKSTNPNVVFTNDFFVKHIEKDSVFKDLRIRHTNLKDTEFCVEGCFFVADSAMTNSKIITQSLNIYKGVTNLYDTSINVLENIAHTGGTFNLGTGEVILEGHYNHKGGELKSSQGYINIKGSYYATGSCNLVMQDEEGYVLINGDYRVEKDNDSNGLLTAGTLELKGNFSQYGGKRGIGYLVNPASAYGFCASDSHKVILSGEEKQTVYTQSTSLFGSLYNYPACSYFNILDIRNTSEQGVNFSSRVYILSEIRQPIGTPILNSQNVYIDNKSAFVDYGELNAEINNYVGNARQVIPTYIDYNNYIKYDYEIVNEEVIIKKWLSRYSKVIIPNNIEGYPVVKIGKFAFQNCDYITDVEFPDSIKEIEDNAFYNCTNLKRIIIPDSVEKMGKNVFAECKGVETIKISNKISVISDSAFSNCRNVTNIIIPDNVVEIGNSSFKNCISLVKVDIGTGVLQIGKSAFEGCTSMVNITIPNGVVEVGDNAFENCMSLLNIEIGKGVLKIGKSAFRGCTSITNITIPDNVIEIGDKIFSNCTSLIDVYIGSGILFFDKNIFEGNISLNNISINDYNSNYSSSGTCIFDKDKQTLKFFAGKNESSLTIEEGVLSIEDNAFENQDTLISVILPNSLKHIGNRAFYGMKKLNNIDVPANVSYIGKEAFGLCEKLSSISVSEKNQYYSSKNGLLLNKDRTKLILCPSYYSKEVVVPDTVKIIGMGAFKNCSRINSVILSNALIEIHDNAFYGCEKIYNVYFKGTEEQWNEVTVGIGNEDLLAERFFYNYASPETGVCGDNMTYTYFGDTLIIEGSGEMYNYSSVGDTPWFKNRSLITNIVFSDGIGSIGDSAFVGFEMEELSIPESVQKIGFQSFALCKNLKNIDFNEGIKTIGEYAFFNCTRLEKIHIPGNVIELGKYAFFYCGGLEKIHISEGINVLEEGTFGYCDCLEEVSLPKSITQICETALYELDIFSSIHYAGNSSDWSKIVIADNNDVNKNSTVYCNYNIATMGNCGEGVKWSFSGDTLRIYGTGTMDDFSSATTVPWYANKPCIKNIIIGSDVSNIGKYAFSRFLNLENVYYAGSESDWANMNIASGNTVLNNCMHIYNYTENKPITEWFIDTEKETINLNILLPKNDLPENVTVIVAGYSDNRLQTMSFEEIKTVENIALLSIPAKDVEDVKVFVWDSLGFMRTLADAEKIIKIQ